MLNKVSEQNSSEEFNQVSTLSKEELLVKIPDYTFSEQEKVLEKLLAKKTDTEIEQCIKDNLETIKAQDPKTQFNILNFLFVQANWSSLADSDISQNIISNAS